MIKKSALLVLLQLLCLGGAASERVQGDNNHLRKAQTEAQTFDVQHNYYEPGLEEDRYDRSLQGGYNGYNIDVQSAEFGFLVGAVIMVIMVMLSLCLLIQCCCRRFSLCDILACVCIWEMCCDGPEAGIGGPFIMF
jgi:hypothetical protein